MEWLEVAPKHAQLEHQTTRDEHVKMLIGQKNNNRVRTSDVAI